jgi:hypothetical protein
VVLRVRGSTGSLGKLTLQRDCGVSWRYQRLPFQTQRLNFATNLGDMMLVASC